LADVQVHIPVFVFNISFRRSVEGGAVWQIEIGIRPLFPRRKNEGGSLDWRHDMPESEKPGGGE
jgi:hypothetical protein